VREGIVAGLEPFIDTIVVCTFTALIILSTGIWNRAPDVKLDELPVAMQTESGWQFSKTIAPGNDWADDDRVMLIVEGDANETTGNTLQRVEGIVASANGGFVVNWVPIAALQMPTATGDGMYRTSTMISWSYYGEQGMVYLAGDKSVLAYKLVYCLLIVVATLGIIKTDADLDNITGVGTAVMLFANIPICWFFGYQAMRAYKDYIARLKSGRMGPDHPPPHLDDLLSGRDVER
jgi:AGCS family alanine or glycine:cation symporter